MRPAFPLLLLFVARAIYGDCAAPAPQSTPQAATTPSPTAKKSFLEKWQERGFSVHQAFDGSRAESRPASIAYLQPLYSADIAAKLAEWDPLRNCEQHSMPIGPVVEWHRTNTPKKSNLVSAKLNIEFFQSQLRGFLPDGTPTAGPPGVTQHTVGYYATYKPALTEDVLTHTISADHVFVVSPISNKNYYPSAITVNAEGRHLWRYVLSIGAEYYGNKDLFDRTSTEIKTADLTFARARLFVVGWPFNANMEDRNEVSADFTYRGRVGGQHVLPDSHYLSVQVTHYADKKHTIGVGVEYDHGRDPNQKFQNLKQGKVSLRFSL